jgi:hypothetical protein
MALRLGLSLIFVGTMVPCLSAGTVVAFPITEATVHLFPNRGEGDNALFELTGPGTHVQLYGSSSPFGSDLPASDPRLGPVAYPGGTVNAHPGPFDTGGANPLLLGGYDYGQYGFVPCCFDILGPPVTLPEAGDYTVTVPALLVGAVPGTFQPPHNGMATDLRDFSTIEFGFLLPANGAITLSFTYHPGFTTEEQSYPPYYGFRSGTFTSAVPESSTLCLLGAGLAVTAARHLRRRRGA